MKTRNGLRIKALKGTLFALLLLTALTASTQAQAQCGYVSTGSLVINHRTGFLYGRNFYARVSCTRYAPTLVYWRGGSLCVGRTFYGRTLAGRTFACSVRALALR